jgi:ABC-type Fe3+-hydroxamate transport system substrate-binding protein
MKESIMFKRFALFVLLFSLLFVVGMAAAQDAPLETNTPLLEMTVVATDIAPEPTPEPPSPISEVTLSWGQLLLLLGLTAVVMIPSGAGIAAIFFQYLARRDVRDTAEKLFLSSSPDMQKLIQQQLAHAQETTRRLLEFLSAVTDGKPNVDLPTG